MTEKVGFDLTAPVGKCEDPKYRRIAFPDVDPKEYLDRG